MALYIILIAQVQEVFFQLLGLNDLNIMTYIVKNNNQSITYYLICHGFMLSIDN